MSSALHNKAALLAREGKNAKASLALFESIKQTPNPFIREEKIVYLNKLQQTLGVPTSALSGFPNHYAILLSNEALILLALIPFWLFTASLYCKIRFKKRVKLGFLSGLVLTIFVIGSWKVKETYSRWGILWGENDEVGVYESPSMQNKIISLAKGTLILASSKTSESAIQMISPITGWVEKNTVLLSSDSVSLESRSLGSH